MAKENMHELLRQLVQLGDGRIGNGPKHPQLPNPALQDVITQFIEKYSFLQQDKAYIEFLEVYAGAGIQHPDEEFVVDLFGFTEVSTNFNDQDEHPIVDENGFLTFCGGYALLNRHNEADVLIPQGFLFDATNERKWGIYRGADSGHYWYCESFTEWLSILVHHRGKMPLNTGEK